MQQVTPIRIAIVSSVYAECGASRNGGKISYPEKLLHFHNLPMGLALQSGLFLGENRLVYRMSLNLYKHVKRISIQAPCAEAKPGVEL